jgi:hypothetical protein
MIYRFVEVEVVTAETLEEVTNLWVERGWQLDAIRFVIGDGDRRPRMAFVSFVRDEVRHVELGEIDLGDAEPFEYEMDWASATRAPADEAAPARPKGKTKKRR